MEQIPQKQKTMIQLFKKAKSIKRKDRIDAIKCEKELLINLLYKALHDKFDLNHVQRMQCLQALVDRVKQENQVNYQETGLKHVRAEKANDVVRNIALFGFF